MQLYKGNSSVSTRTPRSINVDERTNEMEENTVASLMKRGPPSSSSSSLSSPPSPGLPNFGTITSSLIPDNARPKSGNPGIDCLWACRVTVVFKPVKKCSVIDSTSLRNMLI